MKQINIIKDILTFIFFILLFSASNLCFAIGVTPTDVKLTGLPGETINGKISISNTADSPKTMVVEMKDFYLAPENGQKKYVTESLPQGLKDWINIDLEPRVVESGKSYDYNYSINIPTDARPGSYRTALIATTKSDEGLTSSGTVVSGRVISFVFLTIEGDYNESLNLDNFRIDNTAFLQGKIIFETKFSNSGDVDLSPIGSIKIFDKNGNQLKGVYPITQTIGDQVVVTEKKDEIPFNPSLSSVLAQNSSNFKTEWTNREAAIGEYKAKLEIFYGKDNKKLTAETDIKIVENFVISEFKTDNVVNSALPVKFYAKIQNTGTTVLTPTGYFEVVNIFNAQKKRTDFTPEELNLNGGEENILNNISWDSGFALGAYTANLNINVGGKIFTKSIFFWVINWWQIAIIALVLIIIVFGVYKLISNYIKLSKKAKSKGA